MKKDKEMRMRDKENERIEKQKYITDSQLNTLAGGKNTYSPK